MMKSFRALKAQNFYTSVMNLFTTPPKIYKNILKLYKEMIRMVSSVTFFEVSFFF